MTKRPRRLPAQRKYESGHQDRVDRTQWIKPERVVPPPTLPVTAYREITDEDVGLPRNDGAQLRAEGFLEVMIANRLREEAHARAAARLAAFKCENLRVWARLAPGPTVAVDIPDDSIALVDPTDVRDDTDRAIMAELKRLAARPRPSWMQAAADKKAS